LQDVREAGARELAPYGVIDSGVDRRKRGTDAAGDRTDGTGLVVVHRERRVRSDRVVDVPQADRLRRVSLNFTGTYVRVLLMASEPRITIAVARVLREFLSTPRSARYGYDLMRATGYASGKLYPILARLVDAGWLTKEREDIDPAYARRPARYLYRLTEQGAVDSQRELASISEQLAPPISN